MGRVFRRALEKVLPPPIDDLWVRPTTCGHELLYFDKRFQRWHAFHYLVYADEIRELKEFVERIITDDIKDIINAVVDERIGDLENRVNALSESVTDIKTDVEKNTKDISDLTMNLELKVKSIVDDAFDNKIINADHVEYEDADGNIWKLNDYLEMVKTMNDEKDVELEWQDGSRTYTLRNCDDSVRVNPNINAGTLIMSQTKSNE